MTNLENELLNLLEKERAENVEQYETLTSNLLQTIKQQNSHLHSELTVLNKHLEQMLQLLREPQLNDKTNKLQEQLQKTLQMELQKGFMSLQQATEQSLQGLINALEQELGRQQKQDNEIQRILYEDEY